MATLPSSSDEKGGPSSKINGSTLDTATVYSDSSVVDGTAYCYATTAVNSSKEESVYSNIVSNLQIPFSGRD